MSELGLYVLVALGVLVVFGSGFLVGTMWLVWWMATHKPETHEWLDNTNLYSKDE